MKLFTLLFATTAASFAALPSVGPDYQRPAVPSADAFRDLAPEATWKDALPADAQARGAWWESFGDPALNDLEGRALKANQTLQAAFARVQEARADAGLARSAYFPNLSLDPSFARTRYSTTIPNGYPQALSNTWTASLDASWEIDLFGRVRRLNESARADAAASAAAFESVRLTLTADVATTYFSLRATDHEIAIVINGVALREKELKLIRTQRKNGAAADFDVSRAETELADTQAEVAALKIRRASLQDALAVLVGEASPSFAITTADVSAQLAPIPAGLPSDLLERRPDVAAAERGLAAANARIGVAKAAFFPAISLTGGAGYASGSIDHLFTADSRQWSIGPSLYLPIFQGGRNKAALEHSRAAYDEAVAVYRQQLLVAFREVQDALTATRYLAEQAEAQDRAVTAARRSNTLAQKRYDAGFVAFFEVIDAQRVVLANERGAVQLAAQRLTNRVALITALGGGWSSPTLVASLP
jgi:multidrug efflux system outer membrane protein